MKLNAAQKQKFLDVFRHTHILPISPGYNLILLQLNEDCIYDFNVNGFGDQIKKEGLYNNYVLISTIASELPVSIANLPIMGSKDKWITKWLRNKNPEDAILETLLSDDLLIDDFEEFLNS